MLITTIVSGAGTTSLTLANNAVNSVSSSTILFDDGATLSAAATVAGSLNANSGTLYLPWNRLAYVINSPVTLPNGLSMLQGADVVLNETMITSGVTWAGTYRPQGSQASFGFARTQNIYVNKAYPGIYSTTDMYFSYTTLSGGNSNALMLQDGGNIPTSTFDEVQFTIGGTDHMSMGLVLRNGHIESSSQMFFRYVLFTGPQNTPYTSDCTPAFYADNFGGVTFDHIMFSGKGILNRPAVSGNSIIADSFRLHPRRIHAPVCLFQS